jgi:hypothetical protein
VVVVETLHGLERHGLTARKFWVGVLVLELTVLVLASSFLVQIGLWARVFWLCGEFHDYAAAF